MQTNQIARGCLAKRARRRAARCLVAGLAVAHLAAPLPIVAQQGGQGAGQQAPAQARPAEEASGRVRVPTSHANVHMGPTSGAQLLWMAPRDTVLNVTGRDKEWIQVELTPEHRKSGIVVRWYKNETRGWMHDSTVEFLDEKPGAAPRK